MDLANKTALVTGASSGIGRAAAQILASHGASVTIGYHRNQEGAEEARRQIVDAGGRAEVFKADVTQSGEVSDLVDAAIDAFGPIDILVNNAGSLIERMAILELTEELWDDAMALNLKSAFLCSKAVAPSMITRNAGVIINVCSLAGRNGGAVGSIHYAASKGGMIAFTKGLAKELAPHGVRVNGINPGIIATPFQEVFNTPEKLESFAAATPIARIGTPDEVGHVVAFLASDEAGFIVGETIEVNGGIAMY